MIHLPAVLMAGVHMQHIVSLWLHDVKSCSLPYSYMNAATGSQYSLIAPIYKAVPCCETEYASTQLACIW